MTSCIVTQEEQGQTPAKRSNAKQSIKGTSHATGTCIGGTCIGGPSVGDAEKAGWKADSVQSVENRKYYKTEEENHRFIRESFQLDRNKILNADAKLKEAVIKLFLDNFEVLPTHPSQYGETEGLEIKIDLVPGGIPYKSRVRPLNPDQSMD